MMTLVPSPGVERTVSLSIKLSMIVKPIPLRSSPPVVYNGFLALPMSSMPRPQSRMTISSRLSSRIRQRMRILPMQSG